MQKSAPTVPKLLVMVVFALTCFGLLLFLWLSFGGPTPLKPQGYRVKVAFPEATQLGLQADVRVAGVSVGKVVKKDVDPAHPNTTVATLQLENKFSPLSQDAHAILRQKTLLGETYVELTPGHRNRGAIPENGTLPASHVSSTDQLHARAASNDRARGSRLRTRHLPALLYPYNETRCSLAPSRPARRKHANVPLRSQTKLFPRYSRPLARA